MVKIFKLLLLCIIGCTTLDAIIIQTIVLENKHKNRIVLYGDMHVDSLAKPKTIKKQFNCLKKKIDKSTVQDTIFFLESAIAPNELTQGIGIFLYEMQKRCDNILLKLVDPRNSFVGIISFLMHAELANIEKTIYQQKLTECDTFVPSSEMLPEQLEQILAMKNTLCQSILHNIEICNSELYQNKRLIDKHNHSFYTYFSQEKLYQALYEGIIFEIEKLHLLCKQLKSRGIVCNSIKQSLQIYKDEIDNLYKQKENFATRVYNLAQNTKDLLDIAAEYYCLSYSAKKRQVYLMGALHGNKLAQSLQNMGYTIIYNSNITYPDGSQKIFDMVDLCNCIMSKDTGTFPGIKKSDFDYID